jgi:hypothetical protein
LEGIMRMNALILFLASLLVVATAPAETERWIPAAASNAGAAGSYWSTDLYIRSRVLDSPIAVQIAFLSEGTHDTEPSEVSITIPPQSTVLINDVVGTLFEGDRPGALRLRCDYPFDAQSRTFDTGIGSGSVGQTIPGTPSTNFNTGWTGIGAANRPGEDGVRTNIGLFNTSNRTTIAAISIVNESTGEEIGASPIPVVVGPYGWFQTNLFKLAGQPEVDVENATVSVRTSRNIQGYLSRVDNRTNDSSFFPALDASLVYSTPGEWSATFRLEYERLTIDRIVISTNSCDNIVTEDPEPSWTTTVELMSPSHICYHVYGSGEGGHAEMAVDRYREGVHRASSVDLSVPVDGHLSFWNCFDLD